MSLQSVVQLMKNLFFPKFSNNKTKRDNGKEAQKIESRWLDVEILPFFKYSKIQFNTESFSSFFINYFPISVFVVTVRDTINDKFVLSQLLKQ